MDNRNYDGILWCQHGRGYWANKVYGQQHTYVWTQANGEIPDGYIIHHVDGDKSNNQLDNLQLMTQANHMRLHHTGKIVSEATKEKMSNVNRARGLQSRNTSGYKGVHFNKREKKWKANIRAYGEQKHLGYFTTPEQAARAYDSAAKKYFGDDCFVNFPQDNLED